jgi:transcription elongation factor GreA-like protein
MDAELEKLVEAGKLTPKAAERLEELKPGTYCLHKSWGFGKIAEWNLLLNQIVIDFQGKKGTRCSSPTPLITSRSSRRHIFSRGKRPTCRD